MKNNHITFAQFCFSMFLSSLCVLLFIDHEPSVLQTSVFILALIIDALIISFYNGGFGFIIKSFTGLFLIVLCGIISVEFVKYMQKDLGYSSYILLILLILGFSVLASLKGLEPLCRASVIITPFVAFSLLFIVLSSLFKIDFSFSIFEFKSYIVPLLILYPSAIYVLNYNNIIKEKRFYYIIFSAIVFTIIFIFNLLPKDKVSVSIFKGADGLMLAVLTVSVIYFISGSITVLFKKNEIIK